MLNIFRRHEVEKHQLGCSVTAVNQPSFHIYSHTDLHDGLQVCTNHPQKQVFTDWTQNASYIVYSFYGN